MDCCGPYLATLKPQAWARAFGVHPISGTVMMLSVPCRRFWPMNWSAVDPFGSAAGLVTVLGMFSKYQSLARLAVSSR